MVAIERLSDTSQYGYPVRLFSVKYDCSLQNSL